VLLLAVLAAFELRSVARALRFLAPVALVGLAAVAILAAYYGDPIPQSVQAKASNHGLGWEFSRALEVLERGLWPSPEMWLGLPFVAVGIVLALRNASRAVVLFGLGMLAAYAAAGAKTWGWYFYVPLLAWCLAFGEGLAAAAGVLLRGRELALRERVGRGFVATFAMLALAGSAVLASVRRDHITGSVYAAMDTWCREQDTLGKQPTILATDIGAIGWYSGTRILDSEALVWPPARAYERQVDALRAELPDYALVVVNRARMLPFREDPVAQRYEPVARFSTAGRRTTSSIAASRRATSGRRRRSRARAAFAARTRRARGAPRRLRTQPSGPRPRAAAGHAPPDGPRCSPRARSGPLRGRAARRDRARATHAA
jgi:hypothetical protein